MVDRLTPEQQLAFDGGPPIDRRLRPSGQQTTEQARAFAVNDFRACCSFDGIPVPSEQAVEAAIDAAQADPPARVTVGSTVLPRAELRNIDGEVVAVATVNDDGVAVIDADTAARAASIFATKVIRPGPRVVTPDEGESYLRALPFAYRSPYLHAVFLASE